MTVYNFTKSGINKVYAFEKYVVRTFSKFVDYTYSDPNLVITMSSDLTEEELASLTTMINEYVDPAVFLRLCSTITDAGISTKTNSTTPEVVQTYIYTNTNTDGICVFNGIKTVLEYSTTNVEDFLNFEGTASVDFTIKCYTRNFVIYNTTIDITQICNDWKVLAQNGQTGVVKTYKTYMVEGLRDIVASYDCLWQYIIGVSNPSVYVVIHAKQMLYYDVL